MLPSLDPLLQILIELRRLLILPDNCYDWSSWRNAPHALAELDPIIAQVQQGYIPNLFQLKVLFAPTGPIQEVSLSSGWGDEFIALADRFDAVAMKLKNNDSFLG